MNLTAQTIELYAKQLRTPAFNHYEDIIRQLGPDKGYEDFLIALMKMELDSAWRAASGARSGQPGSHTSRLWMNSIAAALNI